jgi:hypothetical protein
MERFCAREARLLSRSPVNTFPLAGSLGCAAPVVPPPPGAGILILNYITLQKAAAVTLCMFTDQKKL